MCFCAAASSREAAAANLSSRMLIGTSLWMEVSWKQNCSLCIFFSFLFVPGKLNAHEGMCVVTISLTWSIYTAAMFRELSPKTLTFDCRMAKLCEERFQRLVMRWLHSLRLVVDSPLLSEGGIRAVMYSKRGGCSEQEEACTTASWVFLLSGVSWLFFFSSKMICINKEQSEKWLKY